MNLLKQAISVQYMGLDETIVPFSGNFGGDNKKIKFMERFMILPLRQRIAGIFAARHLAVSVLLLGISAFCFFRFGGSFKNIFKMDYLHWSVNLLYCFVTGLIYYIIIVFVEFLCPHKSLSHTSAIQDMLCSSGISEKQERYVTGVIKWLNNAFNNTFQKTEFADDRGKREGLLRKYFCNINDDEMDKAVTDVLDETVKEAIEKNECKELTEILGKAGWERFAGHMVLLLLSFALLFLAVRLFLYKV